MKRKEVKNLIKKRFCHREAVERTYKSLAVETDDDLAFENHRNALAKKQKYQSMLKERP